MANIFTVLLALLLSSPQGHIQGTVASSESSLPISFATVEIVELERASDTDVAGYFSFTRGSRGDLDPAGVGVRLRDHRATSGS